MKIRWKSENPRRTSLHNKDGVVYLTFRSLEAFPDIVHGFSTRLGGVSEGIYASMNLSYTQNDEKKNVDENYRRLSRALGTGPENLVRAHQTHTANVRIMSEADRGKGIVIPQDYQDVDGMITNVPGLMLVTTYADCVPLFFVDSRHRAVGLSHSGWRGTVGRIGLETIQLMHRAYGTLPEDLTAVIGPSICQDCYEVSDDVIQEFKKAFPENKWDSLFYKKENGKYQLDLWEANRRIFLDAGIPEDHISIPEICTCCNPELLFSHRASKGKRGTLGAFLGIRKDSL